MILVFGAQLLRKLLGETTLCHRRVLKQALLNGITIRLLEAFKRAKDLGLNKIEH